MEGRGSADGRVCEDLPMVPAGLEDFFLSTATVAGSLIGLLFVAISVAGPRLAKAEVSGQIHRIRANAALTSFVNALVVSLFSLIPGHKIGPTASIMAVLGLVFVVAALLSLFRLRMMRWSILRDALFLFGLAYTFYIQLTSGLDVVSYPRDADAVENIAIVVVICFTIGITRAWELIGGPSIGLRQEVVALLRDELVPDQGETAEPAGTAGAQEQAKTAEPAATAGAQEQAKEDPPAGPAA
jgi:hypothetical protein